MPERTVTILLQEGQSWAAATRRFYRRGQPVTLYINDATFEGRVKFRRLRKLVCVGRFRETPEYIGETPESLRGAAVKIEEAMG